MTNLARWQTTSEVMSLRDTLDRLFDGTVSRPFSLL